jgi:hypothetical protein
VPGLFKVELGPSGAVQKGAGWRVKGSSDPTWNTGTGLYYPVVPGPFWVEFALVDQYTKPADQRVEVFVDQTVTVTANYLSQSVGVAGRHIFYNESSFDGNSAAADSDDDNATASDKSALLPGHSATFANYTGYFKGINGIMVDVAGLPSTPDSGDFLCKVGNDNNPAEWASGPSPSISVRRGAGLGGSDRITLTWPANAIQKQWLQVTVRATAHTGLPADDVFYFGNAIGDCGNDPLDAVVNVTDVALTRANPRSALVPATISNNYDYNRDKQVNVIDTAISRANQTSPLTSLRLISVP